MERLERRFTMLMVCAVWFHINHDNLWLAIGVPMAIGLYALWQLWVEAREQHLR